MDIVSILDTETTGTDHAKDACIEVAVVEYSIKQASVLASMSAVIATDQFSEDAFRVNHIPEAILDEKYGRPADKVWVLAASLARRSEAMLAHNSDFDLGWVPGDNPMRKLPWIDTCWGVNWPRQSKEGGSLIWLAFEHGLGIDDPHRALSDCLLLARLMRRCTELGYDVSQILERGLRPTTWVEAIVEYEDNHLARDRFFKYLPIKGREKARKPKGWVKKMAIEDVAELPFKTREVKVG